MEAEARLGLGSRAFPHSAWQAGLGQGPPGPLILDTALTPAPPVAVVLVWDGGGRGTSRLSHILGLSLTWAENVPVTDEQV